MGTIEATRARLPDWPLWGLLMAVGLGLSFALVGAGVVSAGAVLLGRLAGFSYGYRAPGITLAATVVQDAAMVGAVFLTARLFDGRLLLGGFGFSRSAVSRTRTVLLGVGMWLAFLGFTAAWSSLVGESGKQSILDDLGIDRSRWLWVGTVVLIVVIAPLAEEILFRGFIFATLWKRIPLLPAAVITGALFGALHLGGSPVLLTVPLGVLGLLLCLLRAATGSLGPCIVVHAVNNTLAFGVGEKLAAGWVLLLLAFSVGSVLAVSLALTRRAYTRGDEGSQGPLAGWVGRGGPPLPPPDGPAAPPAPRD